MKSDVLRRFTVDAIDDPAGARAGLEAALRKAGGPLVEPLPADSGSALVTFVTTGIDHRPFVSSQLYAELGGERAMSLVPGTSDVWWAEITAASDVSTVYHFQRRSVPEPRGEGFADPDAVAGFVRELYDVSYADPFNPSRCYPTAALMSFGAAPPPPLEKWQSVLTLPESEPFRWHAEPERRGRVRSRVLHSSVLGNSRTVSLWSPPGEHADGLPLIVLLDGESFLLGMDAPRIFDNLVAGRHVRPFVAALVHNASPTSRGDEYPCHPSFPTFLADELLPAIRPDRPGDVVVGGYSFGGLAACWAAYARPDVFDAVLSLSASLWWSPDGEPEWLTRRFEAGERRPLRFWIDVGSLEREPLAAAGGRTMLAVSRRLRDVLRAGDDELAGYRERPGGHDFVNWRQALPEGLIALLGPPDGRADEHA
jgi:enterochelin esterase family protein